MNFCNCGANEINKEFERLEARVAELEQELHRYKRGVEVEGEIDHNCCDGLFVSSIRVQQSWRGIDELKQGEKVIVLVMKEEGINDEEKDESICGLLPRTATPGPVRC